MAKRKTGLTTWLACKSVIRDWPAAGMRELVHDLYNLSDDNRRFLHARLLPAAQSLTVDEGSRKLRKLICVSSVFRDRFQHIDAKRIVDRYAKASADPAAVAHLLLADLSFSLETLAEVAEYEPLVHHIYAVIERLDKLMGSVTSEPVIAVVDRLEQLANQWRDHFGYGVSDELAGFAAQARERLKGV